MIEEQNNQEYIEKLETMFLDLTNKANECDRKGENTVDLNLKRQYVYEELIKQRRNQYEQQFESIQDDYEY